MKKYYPIIIFSILFSVVFASNVIARNSSAGSAAGLCTYFESSASVFLSDKDCRGVSTTNRPPEFVKFNLPYATKGQPYKGYVEAFDPDGDSLVWEIELINGDSNDWGDWEPYCKDGSKASLYKINTLSSFVNTISSCKVGDAGKYDFRIIIDDGKVETISATSSIYVNSESSLTVPSNLVYVVSSTDPFNFLASSSVSDNALPNRLTIDPSLAGWEQSTNDDGKTFEISASFNPEGNAYFEYPQTRVHNLNLTTIDKFGNKSGGNVEVTVVNNKPNVFFRGGGGRANAY